MSSEALLKAAQKSPEKPNLENYRESIRLLRKKGYTWREIAKIMNAEGIATDHTKIYRLMNQKEDHNFPLAHVEGPFILGGIAYDCRKGKLLRPYENGLRVVIEKKLSCILLEQEENVFSEWVECLFQLSTAPNGDWLQKLRDELGAYEYAESINHIRSKMGFELKFEGNLMAMVCGSYNIQNLGALIVKTVIETTDYFTKNKGWKKRLDDLRQEAKAKVCDAYYDPNQSTESLVREHYEDYQHRNKRYQDKFDKIEL
jgi:hypothetical protein